MSGIAETTTAQPAASTSRASRAWAAIERFLERAGDRLNPILVKEARQALKSRLFMVTFSLLLLCAWGGTLVGLASAGPEVAFGAHGPLLFMIYYVILSFALLVIVPFGAFRSLAAEQEDRTYELLSITALGPGQIVRGKLGSAAVQMTIYVSALAPCIAFTYLLRGIDLPTILFILFWLVVASLGFSAAALLFGSLTEHKGFQIVLSVGTIAGLLLGFGMGCSLASMFLYYEWLPMGTKEFWAANAAILTACATYFTLAVLAATSRITFASGNRSTRLRVMMFIQHAAFIGWWSALVVSELPASPEIIAVGLILVASHWWAYGALMTGESPELSHRVRRRLPQSFLGRVFLTWFNPGPGTGYLFAIGGMLSAAVMGGIGVECWKAVSPTSVRPFRWMTPEFVYLIAIICLAYLTIYLGVGLLVIRVVRKFAKIEIHGAALIHILLALLGCGVPFLIQSLSRQWSRQGYTLLQLTNFLWTFEYLMDRNPVAGTISAIAVLLSTLALVVVIVNVPGLLREVRYVRVAKPRRVEEEDAALAPPPPPVKESPWD